MQQLDFFLYFPFKIAKIKCLFWRNQEKFIIPHQNGFANMSFGFITGKKYPKSLINVEKFLKSMV
jgi:hypothetical protein